LIAIFPANVHIGTTAGLGAWAYGYAKVRSKDAVAFVAKLLAYFDKRN
jgi:hypothetical protein